MNNIPDAIVIELIRELIRLKKENKLLRKGKYEQKRIRETLQKAHD